MRILGEKFFGGLTFGPQVLPCVVASSLLAMVRGTFGCPCRLPDAHSAKPKEEL